MQVFEAGTQINRKTGTPPIIIDRLSRCMQAFGMPRISIVVVIGFPHHPILGESYQECISEDKDALRQCLRCPRDYTRRNFYKNPRYQNRVAGNSFSKIKIDEKAATM